MALYDAKGQFYEELERKIQENEITSEELIKFITSSTGVNPQESTSGFYELCSKFADISLNAAKWADPETCDVQAKFKPGDIEKAKVALKSFIIEHGLSDIVGLLDAIGFMHGFAVAWDDPRVKSTVVQPRRYDWNSPFFGKHYDFCELPDDIWEKIKNEILSETQKDNNVYK